MLAVLSVITGFSQIPFLAWYLTRAGSWRVATVLSASELLKAVITALQGDIIIAVFQLMCAAIWAWLAWDDYHNHRNGRRRAARLTAWGRKSLARLRKLKDNMPSPSPIPQPAGVMWSTSLSYSL